MIVGFALSFYTLLSDQAPFKMPGRAIVKTTVMMMGELEFDVIFVDNYKNPKLLRYRKLSLTIFFLIMLLNMLTMQLLSGCETNRYLQIKIENVILVSLRNV